jgi:hypothetical protein
LKPLSENQISCLLLLAKRSGSTEDRWMSSYDEFKFKCNICNKILSNDFIYDFEYEGNIMPDVILHGSEHLISLNIFI